MLVEFRSVCVQPARLVLSANEGCHAHWGHAVLDACSMDQAIVEQLVSLAVGHVASHLPHLATLLVVE